MELPGWVIAAAVIVVILGVMSTVFVVDRCGAKGLLFGQGAVLVAASGVCDE